MSAEQGASVFCVLSEARTEPPLHILELWLHRLWCLSARGGFRFKTLPIGDNEAYGGFLCRTPSHPA